MRYRVHIHFMYKYHFNSQKFTRSLEYKNKNNNNNDHLKMFKQVRKGRIRRDLIGFLAQLILVIILSSESILMTLWETATWRNGR